MKPSLWRSPIAWTRRKMRLKFGDLLTWLGYKPSKRVDFSNMQGGDFAHVIDVGVADGTPDLYSRFPKAFLDLFEPHPVYQAHLESTVMQARASRLHKMGLGSSDGTSALFLKGRTGSTLAGDRGQGQIDVPVRRLDAVLSPDMIQRPCLLKIDTEGYELEVLRGAEGILPHIDCIVSEVHFAAPQMYRPRDIIAYLDALGYELSEMLDFHAGDGKVWCADFVFRRTSPAAGEPRTAMSAIGAFAPVSVSTPGALPVALAGSVAGLHAGAAVAAATATATVA